MRPKVIYHIECSLDGRIDWVKPDNFLYYRVIQDWTVDAMISGSQTMLAAEMSSDETIQKQSDQFLVVVDSQGQITNWEMIKRQAWWNETPIVLCSEHTPQTYLRYLEDCHIDYLIHGTTRVDLPAAFEELFHRFGIHILRIDSGGILAGVLLRQHLVDEVSVIISPQLTGGQSAKSIYVAPDLTSLQDVIDVQLVHHEILEQQYVFLRYRVMSPMT